MSTHYNVTSPEDCQERYCQLSDKCTAFVYNSKNKTCNLKQPIQWQLDDTELVYEEGKIFGPKYCPGITYFYANLFNTLLNAVKSLPIIYMISTRDESSLIF